MTATKILLTLSIMVAATFVHVAPAAATSPNCATGRNKTQYDLGVRLGKTIVQQAWLSSGQNPDDLDGFLDTVRGTIFNAIVGLPSDASDFVKCRAKGLSQGSCDQLGIIQDQVTGVCMLDGQVWGALSGDLYCALSIAFGGQDILGLLPVAPTNLCGAAFEEACHAEFTSFASELEDETTNEKICVDFTVAPFATVFADWKLGMCAYEIL